MAESEIRLSKFSWALLVNLPHTCIKGIGLGDNLPYMEDYIHTIFIL